MSSTTQHIFSGAGAPTLAPTSLAAHYIDTTTGNQYLAKGTASAADWVLQEKAGAASVAQQAHANDADPHPQYAAAEAPAAAAAAAVDALKQETDPFAQYVRKAEGKGLSTEDFTTEEKTKLAELGGAGGLAAGPELMPPSALLAAVTARVDYEYSTVAQRTIPSDVKAGDLLLACVYSQWGGSLPVPAGWSLVAEVNGEGRAWAYLYSKTAVAADAGAELAIDNSYSQDAISLQVLVFRGASAPVVAEFATYTNPYSYDADTPIPALTATQDGEIALCVYASNSWYADSHIQLPEGWGRPSAPPSEGWSAYAKLLVGLTVLGAGESSAGNINNPYMDGGNDCVALIVARITSA